MPLFLVVADDRDGENQDFFVRASNRENAYSYFKDEMVAQYREIHDKPRIWEVPGIEGLDGVIGWEDLEMTKHPIIACDEPVTE